ncbi:fumarate reductase subunit C [Hahella sp. SMD15-11]|uniref:Fumarate reductase subunit C n=1 Tax=Thermohahella caldifontis TaxID=3142973 RepID=A0AB39UTH5_9GAMM
MARRTYKDKMPRDWFLQNSFYVRYMIREATSVFIGLWMLNLTFGLIRLSQGEAAWNAWVALQSDIWMIEFSGITLGMALYHTWTWFAISPRAMPARIAGRKVDPALVARGQWAGFVVASVLVLWILL